VALPHDLQLHRRLPARDQDHPGDPGGQLRDRGATRLSGDTLFPELDAAAAAGATGFVIRTDGAARGNPGPASLGAALYDLRRSYARDPTAQPDAWISEYLGVQTNNVAEYTGVVRALDLAYELGAAEAHLLLDSKLIVEQLSGRWRVKDPKLIPLWTTARQRLAGFARWSAAHVPRAQNAVADAFANQAIDRVQGGGPIVLVRRPGDMG
jgi:ribonuclease HI